MAEVPFLAQQDWAKDQLSPFSLDLAVVRVAGGQQPVEQGVRVDHRLSLRLAIMDGKPCSVSELVSQLPPVWYKPCSSEHGPGP